MPEKNWTFEEIEALYRQFNPGAIDGGGKKVVVGDSSPQIRSTLISALENKGFEVFSGDSGLTVLRQIREKQPDCCLLDVALGQVGGLDILEALKKDPRYAAMPVIILSARREKRDILVAQKLGAAAFIGKPFQMEEVLRRVDELCGAAKR